MNFIIKSAFLIHLFAFVSVSNLYAESYSIKDKPILVIGASYANGKVPFNAGLQSPLFGVTVNFGNYIGLGDGLIRRGFSVVNEAQGGATTFQRIGCDPVCGDGYWDSYSTQLQRALARVAQPTGAINAQYVIVSMPNDCIHSAAFGVVQSEAVPCSGSDIEQAIQRLIDVGQEALQIGLVPVYLQYPRYSDLDLPLTQQLFGFQWIVNEAQYNQLRDAHHMMITSGLPQAIFVENAWSHFQHLGDGLHPTPRSVDKTVRNIKRHLRLRSLSL